MNGRADDPGTRQADIALECAIAGDVAAVRVLDEDRTRQHVDRILDPPDDIRISLLVSQPSSLHSSSFLRVPTQRQPAAESKAQT